MTTTYDPGPGFTAWIAARVAEQASRAAESLAFYQGGTGSGSFAFAAKSANLDTVSVGGTAVQFVTTPATGKVTIGADLPTSLAALAAFLTASVDTQLVKASYSAGAATLTVTAKAPGAAGNLALAASAATPSGATMTGGSAAPTGFRYPTWAAAITAEIAAI